MALSSFVRPLFYAAAIPRNELIKLVAGFAQPPAGDLVQFPDEAGGTVDRELGVPFLAGMDEVHVDAARLELRAYAQPLEIESYSVTQTTGAHAGVVISLPVPGRLSKVELSSPQFPIVANADANLTPRIVIRPATGQAPAFEIGPPIFAAPAFPAPGPMFGPVLAGISTQSLGGNRLLITFPSLLGSAWLIQLAIGSEATELAARTFTATVNRVVLDAAPRDLSLVIPAAEGDIPLWGFPNAFLPQAGLQDVSFTPIAENVLAERLAAASAGGDSVTLALPLRFQSAAGGAIEIVSRTLSARYLVRPLGARPPALNLRGDWTDLVLSAPAARQPYTGSARLVARLLGRELNAGSPEPPPERPVRGVRVDPGRWAATAVPFEPLPPNAPGSLLPLASVRVYLQALDEAEVVVEMHTDVAGSPGPPAAPPLVRQLVPGPAAWLEFELAAPLPVVTGQAPLWIVLRSTKGNLLWFTAGSGAARVSVDRGATWAAVDARLSPEGAPLVQLFHRLPDPPPAPASAPPPPALSLHDGAVTLDGNLLAGAIADQTRLEYVRDAYTLPAAVLKRLAATTGDGRPATTFRLFARAAMDLSMEDMTLSYEPFQPASGGG